MDELQQLERVLDDGDEILNKHINRDINTQLDVASLV